MGKQVFTMPKRKLGALEVSAIGLGCMSMNGRQYNLPKDEKQMIRLIHQSIELGVTHFDTADVYGPFVNEELVGKAMIGRRDKVSIATKFGMEVIRDTGVRTGRTNSQSKYIKQAIEGSLKRLQTDYVDLYYQHRVDANTPIEESMGVIVELVKEGKIRAFGMSECGLATLKKANEIFKVSAVQDEYSLLYHDDERVKTINDLGVDIVSWSPIGAGFLSGKVDENTKFYQNDYRLSNERFTQENLKLNRPLVDFIIKWGEIKGATPVQIALAWILANGALPIPGTTNPEHLVENLASVNVRFGVSELREFNSELSQIKIHGARLRDGLMQMSNVEAP